MVVRNIGNQNGPLQGVLPVLLAIQEMRRQERSDSRKENIQLKQLARQEREDTLKFENSELARVGEQFGTDSPEYKSALARFGRIGGEETKKETTPDSPPLPTPGNRTVGEEFKKRGIFDAGVQGARRGFQLLTQLLAGEQSAKDIGPRLEEQGIVGTVGDNVLGNFGIDPNILSQPSEEQLSNLPANPGQEPGVGGGIYNSIDFNAGPDTPFGTFRGIPIESAEGRDELMAILEGQ